MDRQNIPAFIKKGYLQGKYFISISKKTKHDLHRFLAPEPLKSEMVYNGLNQEFNSIDTREAKNMAYKKHWHEP